MSSSYSDTPGVYSEISKSVRTKAEETQQLQERTYATGPGNARTPPVDPVTLSQLLEENTTHAKCCYAKSRNVAGYGFSIEPHPEVDEPDESQLDVAREFWFGDGSIWQVGPDQQERATPGDILELAWLDYEAVGWLTIELLTSMDGTPVGLAYLPAMTMRKRRTRDSRGEKVAHGYVQTVDNESRYFGVAGDRYMTTDDDDRVFVDAYDGSFGPSVDTPANEVIFKRNPSPLHPHYGTPDVIPARRQLRGKKAAELYNVEFFENDGVPRLAVIVEGGQLTDKASETVESLLNESKDDESHRTLFLEVEKLADNPEMIELDDGADRSDVEIRIEPLTVGTEEDASFLDYQDHTEHDILQAHEVPPVVANVLKSGAFSTDTDEQRREFADTVIGPKQQNYAELLYETVHRPLGVTDYILDFKTRGLENRAQELEMAATAIEASQGAMTVNEIRQLLSNAADVDLDDLDRPVGNQLMLEAGAEPGGFTAAIEDTVDEAKEEIASHARTERRINDPRIENSD